jgi:hypothetical protein
MRYSRVAAAALLLLYCSFTAALLLLYCCSIQVSMRYSRVAAAVLLLLYYCFTAALLLLYCCCIQVSMRYSRVAVAASAATVEPYLASTAVFVSEVLKVRSSKAVLKQQ